MVDFYRIKSPLTQITDQKMAAFLGAVGKELGEELQSVDLESYIKDDFALLYVASGGSEGFFLEVFEQLKERPCYILTSGDSNSLAASMEILSFLNTHGGNGEIIHGDIKKVAQRIKQLKQLSAVKSKLAGKKYGCIGNPSDWLIASSFAPEEVKKKIGMDFVSIDIKELLDETKKNTYEENEYTRLLKTKDFNKDELEKALYVYGAVKRLCQKYELSGVTVRCFDLLDTVCTTGCMALAILNDEGIYAGCEGDVPALLSMMVLGAITGKPNFLCNPSRFDTKENTAVFAHCTLPCSMVKSFCLNTHFESGIGVAIQGSFDVNMPITIFKTSGSLDRFHVQEGYTLPWEYSDILCRTQIKVHLEDFNYFLKNPINNHHIICLGNYAQEVEDFYAAL